MNKANRLLTTFIPNHYDLKFDIDEENLLFTGQAVIAGEALDNTIKLHAKDLKITSVLINGEQVKHSDEGEHNEVDIDATGQIGEVKLDIQFSGIITKDMTGIYPSNFKHDGVDKKLIATQFEAHHAREAFPCVDEPAAKATFALTITTSDNGISLSNNLPEVEQTLGGRRTTTFKTTPRMSPYLLAFTTGEMHSIESKTKTGTLVRSFSSLAQPLENLQYSVDEGVRVLEFFEDYFKTPYPLEKCDQVALPDFDSGAMENWGMITYREVAMLADPNNRSVSSEQYISLVIAHELSHQWFGNLVTMAWWDDLWLNESFASLMEHIALDSLHPNWHQWEHYSSSDVISSTSRDIYKDIQPVSVEVDDPELIEALFDPGIVYAKGGRLLKMLREHIGEASFKAGLHLYFERYAYKNATRDQLWECLGESSKIDVKQLMDEWLIKPGMPVVAISKTENGDFKLSQERYLIDGEDKQSLWPVPLLANCDVSEAILSDKQTTVKASVDTPVLNINGSSHYFAHYTDSDHLEAISQMIKQRQIKSEARINILNDMNMLARGGQANLVDPLTLVSQMANEDRFNVWAMISRTIRTAQKMTEGNTEARKQFAKLKKRLAQEQYDSLGWDDKTGDDPNTIQMRSMMISFMLGSKDENALAHAQKLADDCERLEDLPSEHRASILSALVRQGDREFIGKLSTLYPKTDPDMQLDISVALASIKDPEVIATVLEDAIGEGGYVRSQDTMRWIAYFLGGYHSRPIMWDMLVAQWDMFENIFKESKSFDFLPVYASQIVSTEEEAQKYRDLFEPLLTNKTLAKNIKIGLADIQARVEWRKREEQPILDWLINNVE